MINVETCEKIPPLGDRVSSGLKNAATYIKHIPKSQWRLTGLMGEFALGAFLGKKRSYQQISELHHVTQALWEFDEQFDRISGELTIPCTNRELTQTEQRSLSREYWHRVDQAYKHGAWAAKTDQKGQNFYDISFDQTVTLEWYIRMAGLGATSSLFADISSNQQIASQFGLDTHRRTFLSQVVTSEAEFSKQTVYCHPRSPQSLTYRYLTDHWFVTAWSKLGNVDLAPWEENRLGHLVFLQQITDDLGTAREDDRLGISSLFHGPRETARQAKLSAYDHGKRVGDYANQLSSYAISQLRLGEIGREQPDSNWLRSLKNMTMISICRLGIPAAATVMASHVLPPLNIESPTKGYSGFQKAAGYITSIFSPSHPDQHISNADALDMRF